LYIGALRSVHCHLANLIDPHEASGLTSVAAVLEIVLSRLSAILNNHRTHYARVSRADRPLAIGQLPATQLEKLYKNAELGKGQAKLLHSCARPSRSYLGS
jgi:hypothetical protein